MIKYELFNWKRDEVLDDEFSESKVSDSVLSIQVLYFDLG